MEVEEEDVYPDDSRFDEMKARLIDTHDVVRYILVPMRFIKKVYHVHVYTQDGTVMEDGDLLRRGERVFVRQVPEAQAEGHGEKADGVRAGETGTGEAGDGIAVGKDGKGAG